MFIIGRISMKQKSKYNYMPDKSILDNMKNVCYEHRAK